MVAEVEIDEIHGFPLQIDLPERGGVSEWCVGIEEGVVERGADAVRCTPSCNIVGVLVEFGCDSVEGLDW